MEVALHGGRWQALSKELGAGSRGGQKGGKVAFDVDTPGRPLHSIAYEWTYWTYTEAQELV